MTEHFSMFCDDTVRYQREFLEACEFLSMQVRDTIIYDVRS